MAYKKWAITSLLYTTHTINKTWDDKVRIQFLLAL